MFFRVFDCECMCFCLCECLFGCVRESERQTERGIEIQGGRERPRYVKSEKESF
jgi:hypothetical protein